MSPSLRADSIGPVDIAVLVFDGHDFNGDVAPAIAELHDNEIVRVIDLAFVRKDPAGTTSFVEVGDAEVAEQFASILGAELDLLSDEDLAGFAAGLEPDTSALVVVFENSWAARLGEAVRSSNGQLASLVRIPREHVVTALEALEEE